MANSKYTDKDKKKDKQAMSRMDALLQKVDEVLQGACKTGNHAQKTGKDKTGKK